MEGDEQTPRRKNEQQGATNENPGETVKMGRRGTNASENKVTTENHDQKPQEES